ncbi:MAG: hypothetical protein WBI20_10290 [Burkholderiaceae bacterium]
MDSLNWLGATRAAVLLTGALGLSPSMALAQSNTESAAPRLKYNSVLSQYQGFNDQALSPWRQTNEVVEKIGGWRAYAKEASQAEASDKALIEPITQPAGKDERHHSHGGKP